MSGTDLTGGPALAPALPPRTTQEARTVWISLLSLGVGVAAGFGAHLLTAFISLLTNLSYFHRWSWSPVNPWGHVLGWTSVLIPVLGGLIVGLMAKYGSRGICGHGIPEAMEQVLYNRSLIKPRLMILKPLSAAIAIGTGGPFGLEGPIIATGGAMGSVLGQLIPSTPDERKTLLGAGAAAGMAATFGSPVSAVLLAIELLLFEFKPRSFVPVALAAATAATVRLVLVGPAPVFPMTDLAPPGPAALVLCGVVGAASGFLSVPVTQALFKLEQGFFAKLPLPWTLWPALGGLAVGLIGLLVPRTLGVGYDNITDILSGRIVGWAVLGLCGAKFISWAIALSSGTSGGTLAPLFTVGGGFGAAVGLGLAHLFPAAGLDPRLAALVGMAALFTGASRALFTSAVFALEATHQPWGLLPLLAGCAVAHLVSSRLMTTDIMTDRMMRRGSPLPTGLRADPLEQMLVAERCVFGPTTLPADMPLGEARTWLHGGADGSNHGFYPLLDGEGCLTGLIRRTELLESDVDPAAPLQSLVKQPPALIHPDHTLRVAVEHLVRTRAHALLVVSRDAPSHLAGLLTLRDLLEAHTEHLAHATTKEPSARILPGASFFRRH